MLQELRGGAAQVSSFIRPIAFSQLYGLGQTMRRATRRENYVAAESLDFDSVSGRFVADINMAGRPLQPQPH